MSKVPLYPPFRSSFPAKSAVDVELFVDRTHGWRYAPSPPPHPSLLPGAFLSSLPVEWHFRMSKVPLYPPLRSSFPAKSAVGVKQFVDSTQGWRYAPSSLRHPPPHPRLLSGANPNSKPRMPNTNPKPQIPHLQCHTQTSNPQIPKPQCQTQIPTSPYPNPLAPFQ